jgi:sporulation protein YunB
MKRFKKNKINKLKITIILIIINTLIILNYFKNNISYKLIDISTSTIEVYNNYLIMNFISNDTLSKSDLNNIIKLNKNSKEEIISIEYDTKKSYEILKNITNELYQIISNTTYKDILDYDFDIKDDLIIYYPVLLSSNNIYLNNLGPKIPVKIKFLSSLLTNLNTKVTSYGLNNVLIEIYINIDITDDIVIPFTSDKINKNYNVLLASKVIMGTIPSFLGTSIENSSPILSK